MPPLIILPETQQSTNDLILDFYDVQKPILGLATTHQIHGKGQYGNRWNMPKDKNLAYSLLVKKSEILADIQLFNYHTAMVVRNFLAEITNEKVLVKWPNDLIINRKKVCGMLIESTKINGEPYYIIGVGINVLQDDFSALPKAGSIFTQTGQVFDLKDFIHRFHLYFTKNIRENLYGDILEEYNRFLFGRDVVSVFVKDKTRQNGIIQHADSEGFLWIQLEHDGIKRFFHKEIEMVY